MYYLLLGGGTGGQTERLASAVEVKGHCQPVSPGPVRDSEVCSQGPLEPDWQSHWWNEKMLAKQSLKLCFKAVESMQIQLKTQEK